MKVEMISYTPNADELIYVAGKKCASTKRASEIWDDLEFQFPEKQERLREVTKFLGITIAKLGHTSIADHVMFSFDVSGIGRSTETQLVRARIGVGFSIQSGRYTNGENAEFITPDSFIQTGIEEKYYDILRQEKALYAEAVEAITNYHTIRSDSKMKRSEALKMAYEDARYIFSQSLSTQMVLSFDGTALLHFLGLRTCSHAQWEIRALANEIYTLVKEVAPALLQQQYPLCQKCADPCSADKKNYKPGCSLYGNSTN